VLIGTRTVYIAWKDEYGICLEDPNVRRGLQTRFVYQNTYDAL
jgi:hypothetical protein